MLPIISLVYDRKHNRKVEACIYCGRKRRYLATGVTLPAKATWRNGIISGCETAPMLNKTLFTAMTTLQEQLQEQIKKDMVDLSKFSLTLRQNNDSFYEWALDKSQESPIKESSKAEASKVLTRWREQGIDMFTDLTAENVRKAIKNFQKTLRPTTIRLYTSHLKKYVNMALAEKIITEDPMATIRLPRGKSKAVSYLTKEELSKVEMAEVSGRIEEARDMFLFACYTGLAYSDLTKIKKSDLRMIDGKPYIIDRRKKTGGDYRIRLLPKAMAIVSKYDFNLNLMKNNHANMCLKALEKDLELKKHISMHVGRHTFATLALSAGIRIETVSRMLAHTNITTTQIYAKVLQKDVDEGFDLLENM